MIDNPLSLKLGTFMELSFEERAQLDRWAANPKRLASRQTIIRQDDQTRLTCLMLEGWAARYKDLRNGKQQIVGLLLPGDTCDLHEIVVRSSDHTIAMMSAATVALIPGSEIESGLAANPRLTRAFWWSTLAEVAILRQWLVNVGRRTATSRVASLFCELYIRAERVGLTNGSSFAAPITQAQLGDMAGLTSVHINRVLKSLREAELLIVRNGHVVIPDVRRLAISCDFDADYLQLKSQQTRLEPSFHQLAVHHPA